MSFSFYTKKKGFSWLFLISYLFSLISFPLSVSAQTSDELKSKIDQRNADIAALQKEIDQYNIQVQKIAGQSQTLQNNIKTLDLTAKKLSANLKLTEQKIARTTLTIQQLSGTIGTTETHINLNKKTIIELLQEIQQSDNQSMIENILTYEHFSDFWDVVEKNTQFNRQIKSQSEELVAFKTDLSDKKTVQEDQKAELSKLQQDLNDQKKIVEQNTQEKAVLLEQTKNQESAYKKILADKKAQQAAYEKELFDYESQLKLITSLDQIPPARRNTLSWPLDSVYVTQLFGITDASARLYVSGSHNGVDFRASIGTPVKAVLDGVVTGTGNTDIYPGCYSFGKWVMIKHPNGLSTIYGHLSVIKATTGQNVSTGTIIGLSGYSGYVSPAGPAGAHLHLGVYATAGVRIEQFVNSRGCKQAVIPLADIKAYLDPMLYLPNI